MNTAVNLTSLDCVRAFLGIISNDDDILLSQMIAQISHAIGTLLNRPALSPTSMVEYYDGNRRSELLLRNWPVVSVQSVVQNGVTLSPASLDSLGGGWVLEPAQTPSPGRMQKLILRGGTFLPGRLNLRVSYTAGYGIDGETLIASSSMPYVAAQPFGAWSADLGVSYAATGAALVAVTAAPQPGQYTVSNGVYTFNAADAGVAMSVNYAYVPADLAQAALEWVAERYRYRDRIGQASKSLGGQETASYRIEATPVFVQERLRPYMRWTLT